MKRHDFSVNERRLKISSRKVGQDKNMQIKEMVFGRIPAYCKYELFMERYHSAAEINCIYRKNSYLVPV